MKFSPIRPLTKFGRISRAIILVALLIGSLFPSVGGIGLATIASPLALLVIVYEIGRWLPKIHPVILIPVFFGLVVLHSQVVAPATDYGVTKLSTWYTATLLTAVAASLLRDEASILTFARAWLVGAGFLSIITIAGFSGGRADGFDSNPIWLARAMATGIVMALYMVMQHHMRTWIFLGIAVLLLGGIFATGSRGPILAVGAGAVALVLFTKYHRIRRVLGITIGAVGAYWAVTRLPFFESSRLVTLLENGDTDIYRSIFWTVTPPLIGEYPDGVGIGNWSLWAGAPRQFNYPHNLFLEVFSELGVWFGIGLIAILVIILIRLLMRSRETPIAILIFGLLVAEIAQVSVSGDLNARTFWFLVALGFFVSVRMVIPAKAPDAIVEKRRPLSRYRGRVHQAP